MVMIFKQITFHFKSDHGKNTLITMNVDLK